MNKKFAAKIYTKNGSKEVEFTCSPFGLIPANTAKTLVTGWMVIDLYADGKLVAHITK